MADNIGPLKVHHLRPAPGRQDRQDPGGSR